MMHSAEEKRAVVVGRWPNQAFPSLPTYICRYHRTRNRLGSSSGAYRWVYVRTQSNSGVSSMYRCPSPPPDGWCGRPVGSFRFLPWWVVGVDFRLLGTRTLSILLPAFSFSFVIFFFSFLGTGLLITSYRWIEPGLRCRLLFCGLIDSDQGLSAWDWY